MQLFEEGQLPSGDQNLNNQGIEKIGLPPLARNDSIHSKRLTSENLGAQTEIQVSTENN